MPLVGRGRATARAGGAVVVGGLLMVALWLVFTALHGPTSFDEHRSALGQDELFWGMLLGVVPNLLIAAGLVDMRGRAIDPDAGTARIGYTVVVVGLLISAAVDLAVQALGPPFSMPFIAIGLFAWVVGARRNPSVPPAGMRALLTIGFSMAIAIGWALVPLEVSDSIGGYRIFGIFGSLVPGVGWAFFGATAVRW